MQYLCWLDHLQPHNRPLVGEAAYSLGVALQQGYPVLPGFIISAPLFMSFLESVDWVDPLFADFPHSPIHMDVGQPSQLQAIAQRIQDLIQSQAFPNDQQTNIDDAVQALQSSRIILRPSLGLDSSHPTLSGQPSSAIPLLFAPAQSLLDTFICESKHLSSVTDAIRKIWSSFFRASHLFYWRRLGISIHHLRLGIIVCPVNSALASGTLTLNETQTEIQAIWGMVSGLKNGDVPSDIYRYDMRNEELSPTHTNIRTKHYAQTLPNPTPDAPSSVVDAETHLIPQARASQSVLDKPLLSHLIAQTRGLRKQLKQYGNDALTVEWSIYPTWPQASAHPSMQWPISDSSLTLIMGDGELALSSLVLDQQVYSLYITEILICNHDIGSDLGEEAIAPKTMTAAVDIALDNERFRTFSPTPTNTTANTTVQTTANEEEYLSLGLVQERVAFAHPDHPADNPLVGIGTSSGQVTAPLWVMSDTQPITERMPDDHILLTNSISPVWLNALQGAKGVISTQGGMTCHAAILARELGIPSVMGVADAMMRFETGDWIVLDGDRGTVTPLASPVYPHLPQSQPSRPTTIAPSTASSDSPKSLDQPLVKEDESQMDQSPFYSAQEQRLGEIKTATQLMFSLSQTHQLDTLAQQSVDGIGLIRAEIMLASLLHHQPINTWLTPDHRSSLIQTIYHHIKQFAQAFFPRPIWYRTLDMRSHEWLIHHSQRGPEINPLLGMHGTMSYQQSPGFFMAELEAIRRLQLEGMTNINLILPFVRTVEEFQFCHTIIEEIGLLDAGSCDVWIMAEVPSILMLLPDYVQAGIQGIAIGSNDLTQLLLATDRTNPTMHKVFQRPHPAVLRAIKMLITTARQAHIPCSLCGELASQHPEVIEDLIRWGITTISVSPDAITQTHQEILRAEKRLFLEWGRTKRDEKEKSDRPFPNE